MSGNYTRYPTDNSILPTGSATAANQALEITQLTGIHTDTTAINGKTPTVGQKVMASSVPVVIASDQTPVPITGTITATNPSVGATGAVVPADATMVGGSDGTDLVALKVSAAGVLSVDTGTVPVTQSTSPWVISGTVTANQGGSPWSENITQLGGNSISTNSGNKDNGTQRVILATDQSTIPVSIAGTVTISGSVTQGTSPWVENLSQVGGSAFSLGQQLAAASLPVVLTASQLSTLTPLSTVAVTQSTSPWVENLTQVGGSAFALGQQLAAASLPVVLTASQLSTLTPLSTVAVTQSTSPWVVSGSVSVSNFPATQPVSGTVTANQGTSPWVENLTQVGGSSFSLGQQLAAASLPVVLTAAQLSTLTPLSTVAATQSGTWTVQPGNTANTTAWLVSETVSSTATLSNVNSSASSVSLLASNSSRKNATFFNDSTAILYLKFGTTASTTSYTVQLQPNGYYELPNGKIYTGAIDGIWSAANGAVRITELS